MSFSQTFTFPAPKLDKNGILAAARKAAGAIGPGVLISEDPEKVDPDPDGYVRPGFESTEEDGDDDGVCCFVGFPTGESAPGQRYAWGAVHFELDEEGDGTSCRGYLDDGDVPEQEYEEDFFDFLKILVEVLGGELEEL